MKNSIKTLSILLLTLLVANLKAATYTYNGTWSPSLPGGGLTSADVVNMTAGSLSLTSNIATLNLSGGTISFNANRTITNVNISGGTLSLASRTLTGTVAVSASSTITASTNGKITGTVTVNGGTLTVSNTATSFTNLILNGGSLTNSVNLTSPITVSANATLAGSGTVGAVTVAGGTLTVSAAKTATTWTLDGGNLSFGTNVLTGALNVTSSGTITGTATLGTVTITDATLNLGSNLTSGALTMIGTSTIDLKGYNWTLGSNDLTVSASATATITNTGLNASVIGDVALSNTTNAGCNLFVGTSTTNATLFLNNVELIIDDLALYGMINSSNGGMLSFDKSPYHSVNGFNNQNNSGTNRTSNTNHVNAIIRLYTVNGNAASDFIFPIGNGTVYAPIKLRNATVTAGGTRYYQVQYVGAKSSNTAYNTSNLQGGVSGSEYWIITTDASKPTAIVTLFYHNVNTAKNGLTNLNNTANITTDIVIAKDSVSTAWNKLNSTTGSATANVFPVNSNSAINPIGSFTFGSTNARTNFLTPLPVSILDFSAKALESSIEVKWSTASEKNNALFVVEKSIDGQSWSAIGSLAGAQTSNVVNQYGLNDYKPVAGFQFYRLKQVDADGSVNYSKAIAVNFSKVSNLNVNIFPNPAQNTLNIQTDVQSSGEVNVQILNSMGELVYNQTLQAGLIQNIDIASFIPGVYYITVATESESKIVRLLKN